MDDLLKKLISIRDYYQIQVDDFNIEIPWGEPNVVSIELEDLIKELTLEDETFVLYPANLEEVGEGFKITFRDLPDITSLGIDIPDVLQQASMDLSFNIQGLKKRPPPSQFRHGDIAVYYHIGK